MLTITVKDTFDNKEYTGEFQTISEALYFYIKELDTFANFLKIVKIEGGK